MSWERRTVGLLTLGWALACGGVPTGQPTAPPTPPPPPPPPAPAPPPAPPIEVVSMWTTSGNPVAILDGDPDSAWRPKGGLETEELHVVLAEPVGRRGIVAGCKMGTFDVGPLSGHAPTLTGVGLDERAAFDLGDGEHTALRFRFHGGEGCVRDLQFDDRPAKLPLAEGFPDPPVMEGPWVLDRTYASVCAPLGHFKVRSNGTFSWTETRAGGEAETRLFGVVSGVERSPRGATLKVEGRRQDRTGAKGKDAPLVGELQVVLVADDPGSLEALVSKTRPEVTACFPKDRGDALLNQLHSSEAIVVQGPGGLADVFVPGR